MKRDFYLTYCQSCKYIQKNHDGFYYCGKVMFVDGRSKANLSFGMRDVVLDSLERYNYGHIERWYAMIIFNNTDMIKTFDRDCIHSKQLKLILKLKDI